MSGEEAEQEEDPSEALKEVQKPSRFQAGEDLHMVLEELERLPEQTKPSHKKSGKSTARKSAKKQTPKSVSSSPAKKSQKSVSKEKTPIKASVRKESP